MDRPTFGITKQVEEVPAAGTKCFPCWLAGHYCRATAMWFEVAVCTACLEREFCPQRRAVEFRMSANGGPEQQEGRERWRA